MHIEEWGRRGALVLLLGGALGACDSGGRPPLALGVVEGRVVFTGPAAEVPVRLVRASDNSTLAEGRTDSEGRYRLAGLRFDAGRFRVEADLGGQPWRVGDAQGSHPADLRLTATLDLTRHGSAQVSVTGYTTLADALAASLPPTQGDPLGRARAGLQAHLALDPVATPVADPLGDLTPAETQHRLLVDALARLGAQLAQQAGRPAALSPGATLLALVEDARGLEPPGLFDGVGPTGPVFADGAAVPLDPDALRHHLAASVQALVDGDPAWIGTPPAQATPLVRRLRCSPSSVFPPCDAGAIDDDTPPVLDAVEPAPGTELRGVVDVRIRAHEPDGSLARVALQLIRGQAREPVQPLPGPGYVFRVDTDAIQGVAQLEAEVVLTNAAGLETRRIATWPLPERAVGQLRGVAHLGAVKAARIRAYDLADPPLLLASATSDETGAFALDIVGYNGPVQVEVGDDPSAQGGAPTQWSDPVRGPGRWPSALRIRALLPEFRASSPPADPLVVSPLTELALARAERARADGELLVGAYTQAASAVAAAVGLPRDVHALHFTRPSDPTQPALAFEDAEKLAFALGCLSARADAIARVALPAEPQAFTTLHLVRLLALDLASDGFLDGLERLVPARLDLGPGPVELAHEPWRTGLVAGCAQWQGHLANGMALERGEVVRHLQRMAANTDPLLFDDRLAAPAFDEAGPQVAVSAQRLDGQPNGRLHPGEFPTPTSVEAPDFDHRKLTTVSGWVELVIEVSDPVGIEAAEARFAALGEETEVRVHVEDLSPTTRLLRVAVNTDQLAERVQVLTIDATDLLGHTTRRRAAFRVDRSPPTLAPELPGVRHGTAWHTPLAETVVARVGFADQSPVQVEWHLNGQALLEARPALGTAALDYELRLQDYDPGRYPLQLVVTDLLGREARIDGELVIDRAAPQIAIQPTQTVDGLDLPPDGAAGDLTPVDLGPEGGLVRRWQTHWAADAGPAAEVAFLAQDNPDGTPPEQLAIRWGWCWADADGACVNGALEANAPLLGGRLPFHAGPDPEDPEAPAGWLGFNPLEGPAPHEHIALTATVTDLAGNTSALPTRPVYRIEVVPPPPVVELWQTPPDDVDVEAIAPGVVVFEELSFIDGSVGRLFQDERPRLVVVGVRLTNPHSVPIDYRISLQGLSTLESALLEGVIGEPATFNFQATPACYPNERAYLDAEACQPVGIRLDCSDATCAPRLRPSPRPLRELAEADSIEVDIKTPDDQYRSPLPEVSVPPGGQAVLVVSRAFDVRGVSEIYRLTEADPPLELPGALVLAEDAIGTPLPFQDLRILPPDARSRGLLIVGARHISRQWDRGAIAVGFVEWAGLNHYEAVFEPTDIEIRNPLLTQ